MGCVPTCGKCPLITRILLLVLLVAIVLTGYLLHEYYLKPWGADTIEDYANSIKSGTTSSNSSSSTTGDVSGHPVDGVACIKCVGVNNIYPVSDRSHPTYGSFQVMVINNGAWVTAVLMIVAVTIGGGGSLIVTLLNAYHGVTVTSTSPTSSTAQNGCGLFEMLFMVSQAQFITMLGSLHLKGSPLFFLKFVKKIAWTNLQIFPIEVDYDPTAVAETTPTITTRSLLSLSTVDSANMTGVERYAVLIGAEPRHLFYYTTLVLAIVLGTVILAYLLLRVLIGLSKKDVAATLDHRVIWVVLQTLLIVQYAVSMTSCFQIYYTATTESQSTGDLGLAIVILAAVCLGVLIFGIVKIARHRDEIKTHGTHEHDELKPFHLRYSVFYLDYNVDNVFFFVGKMVLDITSGAIVGTVQDAPLQIALLIAANGVFLVLLIIRQPYLVPMFYVITVLAGYLRIVMLMLTLVQAKANLFPQDVRDYVAVLTIVINAVLLMCVLARQFYVLSVAIFRWGSRPKNKPVADEELGIPLVEVGDKAPGSKKKSNDKKKDAKSDGGDAKPAEAKAAAPKSGDKKSAEKKASEKKKDKNEIKDSTLFSHQPYHEFNDDDKKKSGSGSGKGGGRRSLYSQKKSQRKQYAPVKDEDLPDWAKV